MMQDYDTTKERLIDDLREMRRRAATWEAAEADRRRVERALRRERQLLKDVLELQERERKLVAYEIHDGLAQQLSGALMQFQAYRNSKERVAEDAQASFDTGINLLTSAMTEARRLISDLRPLVLDESGIVAAIECLVHEVGKREKPEIAFVHDIQPDRLAPPLEAALFRIVQEAMTNACRHSQSDKVRVKLMGENSHICVEVRDWGIGFDPEQIEENRFGMQGIRERVRLLGGEIRIDTAPGKGTRIVVRLPATRKVP